MDRPRIFRIYIFSLLAWVVAFALALKFGSVSDVDLEILTAFRLPRAILASAVGMALAVAGASLQALFSNPLCEPYTLGISSGSALGAVLGFAFGLHWMVYGLAGTAFIGAILFMGILHFFANRSRSEGGNYSLLLIGVMLGFLGSSLVALCLAVSDQQGVQGVLSWLLGDLSRARLQGAIFSFVSVGALSFAIWNHRKELDALLMGEEMAITLGIDVSMARKRLILLCSMLIAVSVSAAGMIGFVGLVVPHFVRKLVGSLHQRLLPLSAIWGAIALTLADTLARMITRPYELPVGAITAVIGAPFCLWVLARSGSRRATS
jgi:ABC-type Fe3+-siderophore transport system permease subunit